MGSSDGMIEGRLGASEALLGGVGLVLRAGGERQKGRGTHWNELL